MRLLLSPVPSSMPRRTNSGSREAADRRRVGRFRLDQTPARSTQRDDPAPPAHTSSHRHRRQRAAVPHANVCAAMMCSVVVVETRDVDSAKAGPRVGNERRVVRQHIEPARLPTSPPTGALSGASMSARRWDCRVSAPYHRRSPRCPPTSPEPSRDHAGCARWRRVRSRRHAARVEHAGKAVARDVVARIRGMPLVVILAAKDAAHLAANDGARSGEDRVAAVQALLLCTVVGFGALTARSVRCRRYRPDAPVVHPVRMWARVAPLIDGRRRGARVLLREAVVVRIRAVDSPVAVSAVAPIGVRIVPLCDRHLLEKAPRAAVVASGRAAGMTGARVVDALRAAVLAAVVVTAGVQAINAQSGDAHRDASPPAHVPPLVLAKREVVRRGDDEVVEKTDTEQRSGVAQNARHVTVRPARSDVAARDDCEQ